MNKEELQLLCGDEYRVSRFQMTSMYKYTIEIQSGESVVTAQYNFGRFSNIRVDGIVWDSHKDMDGPTFQLVGDLLLWNWEFDDSSERAVEALRDAVK